MFSCQIAPTPNGCITIGSDIFVDLLRLPIAAAWCRAHPTRRMHLCLRVDTGTQNDGLCALLDASRRMAIYDVISHTSFLAARWPGRPVLVHWREAITRAGGFDEPKIVYDAQNPKPIFDFLMNDRH